jgi:phage tail-like protein
MTSKKEYRIHASGPDLTQMIVLEAGDFSIGRQAGCSLTLQSAEVSREHALISVSESGWQISDLGSRNRTKLDGVWLAPRVAHALANGSLIEIGPYSLRCEEVTTPSAEESPAAPELPPAPELTTPLPAPQPPGPPEAAPPAEPPQAAPPVVSDDGELTALPSDLPFTGQRLLSYLPGIYHNEFMAGFLAIFEATLAPIEWTVDNFDLFLDPRTAPRTFLPWLSKWYAFALVSMWSEAQCRALLQEAHQIFARCGTRWALRRMLEIYTGHTPEITDQGEGLEPFTFVVKLPVRPQEVNEAMVTALIDDLKPAYTSYKVIYEA